MKIERSKNATRNIIFGFALTTYSQLVPFIIRTVMIHVMGVEYLGLNGLFASILSVLNLAELGVGSAMVFSMYKPIAEDNKTVICALMKLYRTYYRIIGLVIAVLGIALIPFIPKLIKGSIPDDLNIYVLYLMNLGATVITYWLFAYKNCLLSAHQRNDISSKIAMVVSTISYILQILALVVTHNYYVYLIVMIIMNGISNIVTSIIVDKVFPGYRPTGSLPKSEISKINKRVRDLFTAKLGTVIVNSVDTIVISAFLGLKILAVYQNYNCVISAVFGFVTVIFSACTAGIGNSIVVETEEKNYNDLKKFTLLMSWLGAFCCCCFAGMYQPFMKIWVGEKLLLDYSYVILFCLYFYVRVINSLLNLYKDAAGIWHEDRFRPLVTALANLIMNLIMVQFWGLYGIIMSTIISTLFIGMPWLYKNLFTVLFHSGAKKYLIKLALYSSIAVASTAICIVLVSFVNVKSNIVALIINALIATAVSNVIFFCLFRKQEEFKQLIYMIDGLTKGKIRILKRLV